jgi:hypothetical protein
VRRTNLGGLRSGQHRLERTSVGIARSGSLHFHAVIADGVFAPDDAGRIRFHGLAPPSGDMLKRVVQRVRDRSLRWLRKRGLLDERLAEERGNEQPERSALDTCAEVALHGGAFAILDPREASRSEGKGERFEPRKRGPFTAERDGFNLQAAVRIEADDDEGRERLVRYCARPCGHGLRTSRGTRRGHRGADFGISARHKGRLLGGLLLATAPRIKWAKLRKRSFGLDVLRCGHCGSRLRLLAAITDKATAGKILEHLGLPPAATAILTF